MLIKNLDIGMTCKIDNLKANWIVGHIKNLGTLSQEKLSEMLKQLSSREFSFSGKQQWPIIEMIVAGFQAISIHISTGNNDICA